jgi:hypothetical protein
VTGEEGKVGNRILSHGIQFSTIKRIEKWTKWRPHQLRLRALCPPISLMDVRLEEMHVPKSKHSRGVTPDSDEFGAHGAEASRFAHTVGCTPMRCP